MIIFLDIDGVLLPYRSIFLKRRLSDGDRPFCIESVNSFNKIVFDLKAKVVISSAWRQNRSLEELKNIFEKRGVICDIIGITDKRNSENNDLKRGELILKWISDNSYNGDFIVIDDEVNGIKPYLDNFYEVNSLRGLDIYDYHYITNTKPKYKIK